MATPTSGSRDTTIPGNHSAPGLVGQEARWKAEECTKRRAEESASKSGSLSEEEEDEDPVPLNSDKEEYEGSKLLQIRLKTRNRRPSRLTGPRPDLRSEIYRSI